jgi:hypothetical protein
MASKISKHSSERKIKNVAVFLEKRSYEPALDKKALSDVVVACGDKRFDSHKIVLARQSEVFEEMLKAPFKETDGKEVIRIEVGFSSLRLFCGACHYELIHNFVYFVVFILI